MPFLALKSRFYAKNGLFPKIRINLIIKNKEVFEKSMNFHFSIAKL